MKETVKKTTRKPAVKSEDKAPAKPRKKAAETSAMATASNGSPSNGSSGHVIEIKVPHDQVAQLAHRFWAERGHQDGHHEEDWFRAEQELRGKAS
jgi:hypothetical protein